MATTTNLIRYPLRCFLYVPRQTLCISFATRRLTTTASSRDEADLESNLAPPLPPPLLAPPPLPSLLAPPPLPPLLAPPPPPPSRPPLDPLLVSTPREERQLIRTGVWPIGSRRRRAALQAPGSIPFEQLPYQCFQEARKVLAADREEKLRQIEVERERIARWKARDLVQGGGESSMKGRLVRMQKHLQHLKILADINDPTIRMRFEDGTGDMNRPIYRYLADREWRAQRRLILMQRITQMHIVPDILLHLDPVAEVKLAFRRRKVYPGDFVDSRISAVPAHLRVQVFDQGLRLISIAVVNPDVPNEEKDRFEYRCHFLALNILISPTMPSVSLARLKSRTVFNWLPPHAQKGAPYHRLAIFVLQHRDNQTLDIDAIRQKVRRERFNLRSFKDQYSLTPVGIHLFRSKWDEGTAEVMARANLPGADIEWHRKKPEKLPYEKKDGKRYR